MQFTVPQFIEREAKIVGPLTFRQFIYIGGAIAIGLILYWSKVPFLIFFSVTALAGILGFSLAFVKVNGKTLPTVLLNFLNFSFSPRVYFWGKKSVAPKLITRERKIIATEKEEAATLKIAGNSHLKKLSTEIETKTK